MLNFADTFLNSRTSIDTDFAVQVVILIVSAGIIGLERQLAEKPSGIRTSILITLGSWAFVKYGALASMNIADLAVTSEPNIHMNTDYTRIIGQVVTGVGFLGAGSIINKSGLVIGLTTAATIWVQSAIGVLVAVGYYIDALVISFIALIVLIGLSYLERKFKISNPKIIVLDD
jgi:putative Mg2+ transporter-C (MgtC) family protein